MKNSLKRKRRKRKLSQSYSKTIGSLTVDQRAAKRLAIIPTIVIALGGWGAETAARLKRMIHQFGMDKLIRLLVIDTDGQEQGSKGDLPAFSEKEFILLELDRLKVALNNPEKHPELSERYGFSDPKRLTHIKQVIAGDPDQASQVRLIGSMATLINAPMIREAIQEAVSDLRSQFKELELPEETAVKMQNRMNVVMLASTTGGSGSGMLLDTAAIVRDILEGQCKYSTALYAVTPDVHAPAQDTLEQYRCKVNSAHTFRELNAAESGVLHQLKVEVGGATKETRFVCPEKLFSQMYTLQRQDAGGKDYLGKNPVSDAAALHIAMDIMTPMGAELDRSEKNSMISQNLAPDPDTNGHRYMSTIAATGLSFDKSSLLQYAVARQTAGFFKSNVIGVEITDEDAAQTADVFLDEKQLEQRDAYNGEGVVKQVNGEIGVSVDTFLRQLFVRSAGTVREYHKDARFPVVFSEIRDKFSQVHLESIKQRIDQSKLRLSDNAKRDLDKKMKELIDQYGLSAAGDIADYFASAGSTAHKQLRAESDSQVARHQKFDKQAQVTVQSLTKFWFKRFRRHSEIHDRAALAMRSCIAAAIDSEVRTAAATVMQILADRSGQWRKRVAPGLKAARESVNELKKIERKVKGDLTDRVTTGLTTVLNVATPAFYREFYRRNRIELSGLMERLSDATGLSSREIKMRAGTDANIRVALQKIISGHFTECVHDVHIGDVIEHVLENEPNGEAKIAELLTSMIQACQPMWQLSLPRATMEMNDTFILGLPASVSSGTQSRLKRLINDAVKSSTRNSIYRAKVNPVPTNLTDRIVCLRRSEGGRPNYLTSWKSLRAAAEKWEKEDPHPIGIFAPEIAALFPHVEPLEESSLGELAFALGLAYGMIARRGSSYYDNLVKTGHNGSAQMTCRLRSDANCIVFDSGQLHINGAIKPMVDQNRLKFENRGDIRQEDLIAQGREKAMTAFIRRDSDIAEIMDTFELMRQLGGDATIAAELRAYTLQLRDQTKANSSVYDQVAHEIKLLEQKVDELQQA